VGRRSGGLFIGGDVVNRCDQTEALVWKTAKVGGNIGVLAPSESMIS
jgi:hypothetical protein